MQRRHVAVQQRLDTDLAIGGGEAGYTASNYGIRWKNQAVVQIYRLSQNSVNFSSFSEASPSCHADVQGYACGNGDGLRTPRALEVRGWDGLGTILHRNSENGPYNDKKS
jgi:hypothetical protein